MISIEGAITVVVYLIVAGLIFGLLFWLIDYVGLPQPFDKVARIILACLVVMVLIGILLSIIGHPVFRLAH